MVRMEAGDEYKHARSANVYLRDFDLAKGLRKLEGKASIETARRVPVRIPLDVGARTETPFGVILVRSVEESKGGGGGSLWLIGLKREGPELRRGTDLFEPRIRFDDGEEQHEGFSARGEFELRTRREGPRPKVLLLKTRSDLTTVTVPFSFTNVLFKAD